MNWLVTGGCGFIGTALIRSLMQEGDHAVRVVDNLSVGTREDLAAAGDFVEVSSDGPGPIASGGQVELLAGDITDKDLALRAARGADVIVHFAANTGVMPSVEDPRGDCMSNVVGTLNYLEAARHNDVGRFVFASSGGTVIGEVEPPIHEEMVPHPVAPYGASKLAGEGYCSAYFQTFGVETVALRFGNVYGPLSGHKNSVVARFIKRAVEGEVLEIYGDGTQTRDFIFVDDLDRGRAALGHRRGRWRRGLPDRHQRRDDGAGADGQAPSRPRRRRHRERRGPQHSSPPRGGAPQLRRHLQGAANARLEGRSRPRRGPQAHRGMVFG